MRIKPARLPFLLVAFAGMVLAALAGLGRLGWAPSVFRAAFGARLVAAHGPLMVAGFLGTLIGLERAVALGRPLGYVGPGASAAGALVVVGGGPPLLAGALLATGAAALVATLLYFYFRDRALHALTLVWGAAGLLAGDVLLCAGWPVFRIVLPWVLFLVLTIAGERLELARLASPPPWARATFGLLGTLLTVGAATFSARLAGAAMVGLSVWLLRYDMALRTVRLGGLPRFVAVSLICGNAWLGLGGLFALAWGNPVAGPHYDAVLHAVFVGFTFAMIFGHAPIVLPAVVGVALPFSPLFYLHLGLLQLSLAVRIAGDLAAAPALRLLGAQLNVVALLLFLAVTVTAVARGPRARRRIA